MTESPISHHWGVGRRKDISTNHHLVTLININKAVYRTIPATSGLLIITKVVIVQPWLHRVCWLLEILPQESPSGFWLCCDLFEGCNFVMIVIKALTLLWPSSPSSTDFTRKQAHVYRCLMKAVPSLLTSLLPSLLSLSLCPAQPP